MPAKFINSGKVVVLLRGRYAGKKAVVVRAFDNGTDSRQFGHALVAGINKYPLKVSSGMAKKKIAKRSRIKPFVKVINYNHVMPTRYGLDVDLKKTVTAENVYGDSANRRAVRKAVKKAFEDRYKTGKNKWFFSKLRF
jgi:large subunit ribosomal protein L27e